MDKYIVKLTPEERSELLTLIRVGKKAAKEAAERGKRLPTYTFLGFTCYWGQSRNGQWRLKYRSRSDRFAGKFKGLREYLRTCLSEETVKTLERVKKIVRGWINYHAISDNQRRVGSFILQSKRIVFCWINRKGGNRKIHWVKFAKLMQRINYPQTFKMTSLKIFYGTDSYRVLIRITVINKHIITEHWHKHISLFHTAIIFHSR